MQLTSDGNYIFPDYTFLTNVSELHSSPILCRHRLAEISFVLQAIATLLQSLRDAPKNKGESRSTLGALLRTRVSPAVP